LVRFRGCNSVPNLLASSSPSPPRPRTVSLPLFGVQLNHGVWSVSTTALGRRRRARARAARTWASRSQAPTSSMTRAQGHTSGKTTRSHTTHTISAPSSYRSCRLLWSELQRDLSRARRALRPTCGCQNANKIPEPQPPGDEGQRPRALAHLRGPRMHSCATSSRRTQPCHQIHL